MNAPVSFQQILPAWERFQAETGIAQITDNTHYEQMLDLLSNYEAAKHPSPPATGLDALKFLMEQRGLKQSQLPEVGSQGVVSEILSGKRELNIRQVRALAKRFQVSPATFL